MPQSTIASKLPFTGSTGMGTSLNAQCAPLIRKLGLELGGNTLSTVVDDADLDGTIIAKFRSNVQRCVGANRICVQAGVYNAFAKKLTAKLWAPHTGNDTGCGHSSYFYSRSQARV